MEGQTTEIETKTEQRGKFRNTVTTTISPEFRAWLGARKLKVSHAIARGVRELQLDENDPERKSLQIELVQLRKRVTHLEEKIKALKTPQAS